MQKLKGHFERKRNTKLIRRRRLRPCCHEADMKFVRSCCNQGVERTNRRFSSRWTGWVSELTCWSSRLQENYPPILEESMEYTSISKRGTKRCQSVTNWLGRNNPYTGSLEARVHACVHDWVYGLVCPNLTSWTWRQWDLKATWHNRLRARDHYTSSTLIGGKRWNQVCQDHVKSYQECVKFASYYVWGTNGGCECEMDVKLYMVSYSALNGSCFMITWTVFKSHLLEVGLTQNRETMALWMLTTVDLFY